MSFYTFETLKNLLLEKCPAQFSQPCPHNTVVLSIPGKILCGGFAGAFAQTLS